MEKYSDDVIKIKQCACKGIRTCAHCENNKINTVKSDLELICLDEYVKATEITENDFTIKYFDFFFDEKLDSLKDSIHNEKITIVYEKYTNTITDDLFSGFYVISKLLKEDEIENILKEVNNNNWLDSQSGRKKQDYGPQINYKKKKVKFRDSSNFPEYAKLLQGKLNDISFLKDFKIAEIGNLLYIKDSGAHIDPHIDDYWIWGNYIIGINLLSETVLTFTYELNNIEYELNFKVLPGEAYIMSNESRYIWKHSIKRENITADRIVITLREYYKNYINN
jgi:alkylated DNA repair protein alkB family protein 4